MSRDEILELAEAAVMASKGYYSDKKLMIYESTNENLTELFEQFPVSDKDVFTVLASSDQPFSCYYHKAKSIDTFDRVHTTLFYYYLRKWIIMYQNRLYPSYHLFYDGDLPLYCLICDIEPTNQDEADAQFFWKHYLGQNSYKTDKFLFFVSMCNWPVPFERDIDSIKGIFDKPISFQHIDMFKEFEIKKNYDILVLSNLLEHTNDEKDLIQARKNIEALLRDDGVAICTQMRNKKGSSANEREIDILTSGSLEFDNTPHQYYEPLCGGVIDFAYSYKKRKKYN